MKFQYRVTKYNPQYRDERSGGYLLDEWTSICDIGKVFNGEVVTKEEYDFVEDAYVKSVLSFMDDMDIQALKLISLENTRNYKDDRLTIEDNKFYNKAEIEILTRLILRGEIWTKLIHDNMFVHFGYDYYMYIGVNKMPSEALDISAGLGLFPENFSSPYN